MTTLGKTTGERALPVSLLQIMIKKVFCYFSLISHSYIDERSDKYSCCSSGWERTSRVQPELF